MTKEPAAVEQVQMSIDEALDEFRSIQFALGDRKSKFECRSTNISVTEITVPATVIGPHLKQLELRNLAIAYAQSIIDALKDRVDPDAWTLVKKLERWLATQAA